jgi:hypothetical protein
MKLNLNWKKELIRGFLVAGIFTTIFNLWQVLDLIVNDRYVDVMFMIGLTYLIYFIIYKLRS